MTKANLVDFVTEVQGEGHLRIEHDFGDGFVRLHTSEAERRQAAQDIRCSEDIVIELLRNARDAHASHIFLAVSKEGTKRVITVIDDGDGIPEQMHEKVFLPRVTSKLDTSHMDAWGLHGRGMALFSIAENSLTARVVASQVNLGCAMNVVTETGELPEKRDQSTFPRFILGEGGNVAVRGPKNILRTACEFAIESRNECAVFIGSPAEMAASLYAYGSSTLSAIDKAFCKDVKALPLVKRLAIASDPQDFADHAAKMGLTISTRTARRILDGSLGDFDPLLEQIVIEQENAPRKGKKPSQRRRMKLQKEDSVALSASCKEAFAPIAQQYYLEENVDPTIRITADKLTISFPLVEKS